ncbi:MAG: hypothetical protein HKL95_08385 [Phycisphaerae bacterium]|nr:hypothetical protein [Phycisphaerae bacterium]
MTENAMSEVEKTQKKHSDELHEKYVHAKGAVLDLAAEARRAAADYARDIKHNAAGWVHEKGGKLAEGASDVNDTVVDYVRRNPYTALGIAAAAGLVLGLALRRRS